MYHQLRSRNVGLLCLYPWYWPGLSTGYHKRSVPGLNRATSPAFQTPSTHNRLFRGFASNTMPVFDPSNYFNRSKTIAREEVLRQILADLQGDHPGSHVLITHDGDKVKIQRSDSVTTGHVDLYNNGLINRTYGYDWWVFKQAGVEYKGSTK